VSFSVPDQLTLDVKLHSYNTFDNFIESDKNKQLLNQLRSEVFKQNVFIWGQRSPGRTHLLHAALHHTEEAGGKAVYIPLQGSENLIPSFLKNITGFDLICIDDAQYVAGDSEWEAALFTVFNNAADDGSRLLISSTHSQALFGIKLKDLVSRLQSCLTFQVHSLDDGRKRTAVLQHAAARGLGISESVVDYLMARSERSLPILMGLLGQLDDNSLQQKRRITIPLVKEAMGWL
jgi:DnaA family protein